jgi:hypothetical protein
MTDNNTRKFPRTMEQAFGPYHRSSGEFQDEPQTMSFKSIIAYVVVLALTLLAVHLIASN